MVGRLRAGDRLASTEGVAVRVVAWAAEGSYARVYRAERDDGGSVAIKLAKAEVPGAAERLRVEAIALSRVQHPRLVRLVGRGEWERLPFHLIEWIDGETLRDRLARERRLPLRIALALLRDQAAALAALHAAGIAHGDARPENLLVNGARATLIDLDSAIPLTDSTRAADLALVAANLRRMLTGDDATPLSPAAGHPPAAIRLAAALSDPAGPPADAIAAAAERLLAQLAPADPRTP